MTSIHERLKEYRNNIARLSQEEISERLRMSQGSYSKYETGESKFSIETLLEMKEALHIPPKHFSYIIQGDEEEKMDDMVLRERYEDAEMEMIINMVSKYPKLKKTLIEMYQFPDERKVVLVDSFNGFLKLFKKIKP